MAVANGVELKTMARDCPMSIELEISAMTLYLRSISKASFCGTMLLAFVAGCSKQDATTQNSVSIAPHAPISNQVVGNPPGAIEATPGNPNNNSNEGAAPTSPALAPSPTPTPEPPNLGAVPQPSRPAVPNVPDFTNLTLPEQADAKSTIDHLGKIDKSLQSLLVLASANQVSRDEAMRQAKVIGDLKLQAAEHLESVATLPLHQELALLAKMEGLSHQASLGEENAAKRLRQLASSSSNFKSDLVAHQAAIVMLGLELSDLAAGLSDANPVLKQLEIVLADPSKLKLPDFHASAQTIQVLDQHNMVEASQLARQKIFSAFGNHPDPQIAFKTWYLQVGNSPEFTSLNSAMSDANISPNELNSALKVMLAFAPTQWTLSHLMQKLTSVEYSGQTDKAGLLASAIQENFAWITTEKLKVDAQALLGSFSKRAGAIGKTISFDELTLIQSEQAFDPASLSGKVVLIDFWASWCGHCRAEFPNLREQYAKYYEKGFEIVGINLDGQPQLMQAALQRDPLPWVQAYSANPEKKEFKTQQAVDFGVEIIPFMMLVGRDGKVIAIHTRGPILNQKLAELFPQ
jgi:thiol-disulfide isomerase/thioredoxin